jgi:nucleoside-diphosphate-sugar epimerase
MHDWDLTVLRPGFIWGRDHAYLAALGQQIGPIHIVIGPTTRIPMTHVENCADLFALSAEDARAAGQTFNVVDGEGERIWSFLGDYLKGMGERGIRVPVPYTLVYWVVKAAFETVFRRNLKLPQILIPCRFESRLKPLHYTNARVRDVLGWKPPLSFQECLSRTFAPPRTNTPARTQVT